MTERERRQRQVDLSVVTVSALGLTGAWLLVASVDAGRRAAVGGATAAVEPAVLADAPAAAAVDAPRPTLAVAPAVVREAPARGLTPAPRPRRRVVVVRRSRAS